MSKKTKRLEAKERQKELLNYFDGDFYQEKYIKDLDLWLIKQFNGNTGRWQVARYSPLSFERYKRITEESEFKRARWEKWNQE